MTNILLYGGSAGLSHALYTINYAISLAEKLLKTGHENVRIYNAWRCIKDFDQIFDVTYPYYSKHSFDLSRLNNFITIQDLSERYGVTIKDLLKEEITITEKNIILNAASTAKLPSTLNFFEVYKLQLHVFKKLKNYYTTLDAGNYIGIHFRGSDILKNKKINYEDFLSDASKKIEHIASDNACKILLASDNQDIIVKYVDNEKIFSYSLVYTLFQKNVIIENTQRLHCSDLTARTGVSEYEILENATVDKFLLAHSKKLYADLNSGYGQDANYLFSTLQKNKNLRILK